MDTEAAKAIIYDLGFPAFHKVPNSNDISYLFGGVKTSGIYCLRIKDNIFYVGKSINIPSRFKDHVRRYINIDEVTFIPCDEEKLDELEAYCIHSIEEAGIINVNVQYSSHPNNDDALSSLIPLEEEVAWVNGDIDYSDESRAYEYLNNFEKRIKRQHKYEKFLKLASREYFIDMCAAYIYAMVPSPFKTEYMFWGLSCLPSTARISSSLTTIFCFNIYRIETFVLVFDDKSNSGYAYIVVSKTVLIEEFGSLDNLLNEYKDCELPGYEYENAGFDHVTIGHNNLNEIFAFLTDERVAKASRVLNLRLMKKGTNFYKQYHSFQLADLVFESMKRHVEEFEADTPEA